MDGEKIQEYAVSVITRAGEDKQQDQMITQFGCTLCSTVYVIYNTSNLSVELLRTKATVTSSDRPKSLLMQNAVYTGWTENMTYSNSNTINSPDGIYFLASPYRQPVNEVMSDIMAGDTITMTGGSSFYTEFHITPETKWD